MMYDNYIMALDKMLYVVFFNHFVLFLSYFSIKTEVVGTH